MAQQAERLKLYRELDSTKDEAALQAFESRLADRFGPPAAQRRNCSTSCACAGEAIRLGIERVKVKNGLMILHFVGEQNSPYYKKRYLYGVASQGDAKIPPDLCSNSTIIVWR